MTTTRAPKTWHPATKSAVDALRPRQPAPGKPTASAIFDAYFRAPAPKGFHVRVFPSGRKVFALRYRDPAGGDPPRYLRHDLGEYGPVTVPEALARAAAARARLERGDALHRDKAARRAIPTVDQLAGEYLTELERTRKASTAAEARRLIEKHLTPALGRELVTAVTGRDLQRLHAAMAETPVEANRLQAAASGLFAFAIRRGDLTTNPAAAVTKYPETSRDVEPLTDAQAAALGKALHEAETAGTPWQAVAIIRFLFLTGCRRSEAEGLRWEEVDTDRARLVFLDSKGTKRGRQKTDRRPIGAPVLTLLKACRARCTADGIVSPFVFPSPADPGAPYANLDRHWRAIRTAAELPALRLHDLRHDVASDVGMQYPTAVVQAITGHRTVAMAGRYVHAKDDPMTRAADTIATERARRLADVEKAPARPVALRGSGTDGIEGR